jgi:uncharacterized membrane protein
MIDHGALPDLGEMIRAACGWVFSYLCHQNPDSLFHLGGRAIPVCWRCAGMHIGCAASCLRFSLHRLATGRVYSRGALALIGASFGILVLHWLGGQFGVLPMTPLARFGTGLLAGASVGSILSGRSGPSRVTTSGTVASAYLAAGLGGLLLIAVDRWSIGMLGICGSIAVNLSCALSFGASTFKPYVRSHLRGAFR